MDIDAHNAQINELNDAKIQQIKAQKKLFGGIIKKGDPLYKNIINVILFALLFPCMIIFELVIGIKNLSIYIWESLISFINFTVLTYNKTKQYIIVNYYFFKNWIYNKGSILIGKLINGFKKFQYVKLLIIYYFQTYIVNNLIIIYQWIKNKFIVLFAFCNFWFQKLFNYIKMQVLTLMRVIIKLCKLIIFKVKQIILIIYTAIKRLLIYFKEKIIQFLSYVQQIIKKISAFFYEQVWKPIKNKIVNFSCYLFNQFCHYMIKIYNALINYGCLILNYLKKKYLQLQDWIYVQIKLLVRCMIYLKNKLIDFFILLIDYLLGKYKQLKQNVISPFNLKIKELSKKIKNLIIDIILKTIDLIKLALIYLRDEVIIKLKDKIWNYYKYGSKKRGKMWTLKAKQVYNKMRENSARRYQNFLLKMNSLQEKIKIIAQIIFQKIKIIWIKIKNIAKYCISKIKIAYKFIKKLLKLGGQLIKRLVKLLFRSIKQLIKWVIELQCKIIVKFIIVFRIFNPIIWLIEKFFEIMFNIISYPFIQLNKFINTGMDFVIYEIPNKLYNGIVYIIEKFIQLFIKIERLIDIIIKQSKKIITIINQKIIQPIVRIIIYFYKIIKNVVLTIVQSLINFKDMIKYNYVLPAWASIRLFGVKIRNIYLNIKQKVILTINYGIQKIKLTYLFLKDSILFVKNKITNFIKQLIQFIKGQIQLLWQQIKFVYGIMIGPLIQFKNYIIQVFLSFKQMISNYIKILRDFIVGQCIIVKEAALAIQNKMKELLNSIKQSMIDQFNAIKVIFKNIYDSLKLSLIQIKNQIRQQMEQIKQSLIQQKNAIAEQFRIIGQSIKMQGIQVKEGIVTFKKDMIQTIKMMFKRG